MENLGKKIGFTDKKLQKLLRVYAIAAAVFIVIFAIAIIVKEYVLSYDETLRNLERIRTGLVRIDRATKDMRQSIVTIERVVPLRLFSETPEKQILSGLDELKTAMKNSTVNILEITKKDNKIILPLTIKGTITDYSVFVNDIGKLQAMRFPFVTIGGITIGKEDVVSKADPSGQKNVKAVVFEITGELTTLSGESAGAQGRPENAPRPQRFLR